MFEIRRDTVLSDNGIDLKSFAYASPCIAVTIFIAAGKTRDSPIECGFFVFALKYETSNDTAKAFCETVENV